MSLKYCWNHHIWLCEKPVLSGVKQIQPVRDTSRRGRVYASVGKVQAYAPGVNKTGCIGRKRAQA